MTKRIEWKSKDDLRAELEAALFALRTARQQLADIAAAAHLEWFDSMSSAERTALLEQLTSGRPANPRSEFGRLLRSLYG